MSIKNKKELINEVLDLYQRFEKNPKQDIHTYQITIDTIKIISKLFNQKSKDYQLLSKILNLLIHLELQNIDII